MWVRFTRRFTWRATPAVSKTYKPDGGPFKDGRYPVTRDCAAKAGAVNAAAEVPKPMRPR